MRHGCWGKVLFVDLSCGEIETLHPQEAVYRRYLGGVGLGAYFLYRSIPPGADPLGPDNLLAFLPGLLTGTHALFSGRFMVAARSPLTGAWGEANCGGDFGPALRAAACDGVFIRGRAREPVYLLVDEGGAQIRKASHLWGLDVAATEAALREELGPGVRVSCIGPAGEKLSLISGIVNDDGRIAARCGLGAVMGSKKLKAVVARGKARVPLADLRTFKAANAQYRRLFRRKPSTLSERIPGLLNRFLPLMRRLGSRPSGGPADLVVDTYRRYGTASGTALLVELGDTPVRNWRGIGHRDFPLELSEKLSDRAVVAPQIRPYACHSCPVACGGIVRQPGGGTAHRPEYETLASFGPLVMNSDLAAVQRCNQICNMAGLDSISTGAAVAFALECAERGWLPADLAGELPLAWGDGETLVELTRRIAARQPGLGDWLADGVARALQRLSPGAQQAAIHAGGQELAMHRGLYEPGVAAGYALDPAPGRHSSTNSGNASVAAFKPFFQVVGHKPARRYDYRAKGREQAWAMCLYRAFDSLGLCHFALLMGEPPFMAWLNAATGWEMDEAEFIRIGKRIQVLRHAFNARHGLPAQFPLPGRERGDPPLLEGPLRGKTLDLQAMAESYFETLGLDPRTGLPREEIRAELDLGWIREEGP